MTSTGTPASQDASTGKLMVDKSLPKEPQDTSVMDAYADPVTSKIFEAVNKILNPVQQTTSLMDDYKSLYKESGLDQINQAIIDADTVIHGTEADIRREIESSGGMGTESQVQSMALSRNKSLLVKYNQLVQMKTDATNQLATMSQLNAQDKQMLQQKTNQQLDTLFKMATFQQQATNNIKEGFNNLVKNVGYAGAYQAYASNPGQLAYIEQISGLGTGGLQKLSTYVAPLTESQQLDNQYKQAQIRNINSEINARGQAGESAPTVKTINGTDMQWNPSTGQWEAIGGTADAVKTQNSIDQLAFLRKTAETATKLSSASGASGLSKWIGDTLVGDTKFRQLEAQTNTLRTNMLTLMTDPAIKKFFGPQMSNADVLLMTAAGTTLNPASQSPSQIKAEIKRLDDLFARMQTAVGNGGSTPVSPDQVPEGYYQASDGLFYKK